MQQSYKTWLEAQKYDAGTISAQLHRAGRVEKLYGDLDDHYVKDRIEEVISTLRYSTDDQRRLKPNPSKIPFDGDIYNNLASYRNATERYRKFRDGGFEAVEAVITDHQITTDAVEDLGQRIGLERDMQASLRLAINELEDGLQINDGGVERSVGSGFIDITALDRSGAVVVIELKAGAAGQRAVAQILSYMGDVAEEESGSAIRGILVASSFDSKAKSAARMVPALSLVSYGVKFKFERV